MAEDLVCLLDYLGWKGKRELNIVGISLGGMIAQGMYGWPCHPLVPITDILALSFCYRGCVPNP